MEKWKMVMKVKKLNLYLIICLIFSIIISGYFYKTREKEIVISVGMFAGSAWDVPYSNCYDIMDNAILKFENKHPGVKVKYVNGIMKEDYSEWLSEQLLKGKGPDVFFILPEDFNMLSNVGSIKNLNKFIEKDNEFNTERFYRTSLKSGQYEEKQYAIPYESAPVMMFVNKTLLNKEEISMPDNNWTFEDFYNVCRKVTKDTNGDGIIDQFGCYGYTWRDAVCSNGAMLFNEEGTKAYFRNEKVQEAVGFVKKLNALNNGYNVTAKDFDNGKVAFYPLPFPEYEAYKIYPWKIKKFFNFDWECIKMPAGKYGTNASEIRTVLVGINSKTKEEKLAWKFLKSLTYDEEIQRQIFNYSQGVSVLKDVTNSDETLDILKKNAPNGTYINMNVLNGVMENGTVTPRFRKYQTVMEMADNILNQYVNTDVDDDNLNYYLSKVDREVDNILKNK